MKKTKILLAAIAMFAMSTNFVGCGGCNGNDIPTTPTIAPTETVITNTPTPEVTAEPTAVPNTPTPVIIATPEPTNTPEPTPTEVPKGKLLASCKVGDNAWFDYYEDGLLVLRGTGSTCGFKNNLEQQEYLMGNSVFYDFKIPSNSTFVDELHSKAKIVIEEGITEIGSALFSTFWDAQTIIFPNSLTKIDGLAFENLGLFVESVTFINFNPSQYEIAKNAFYGCTSIEGFDDVSDYTAAPTATPLPTATPTPNPDKPRKAATLDVGNNITYEFWDNGVMYVKGKGEVPDKPTFWAVNEKDDNPTGYVWAEKVHTVIIEEGITGFGDLSLSGIRAEETYLPTTYRGEDGSCLTKKIYGYYEGKAFVATRSGDNPWLNICDPFEMFANPDYYLADTLEITRE